MWKDIPSHRKPWLSCSLPIISGTVSGNSKYLWIYSGAFYRYERVIDWRKFAEKLRKYGLIKTTIIILDQLESLWHLSEGPLESFMTLRKQLATFPIHTPKLLLNYFKMDIEKKTNKAPDMEIAKLVLDKKSKILYSFVKIFFPRPQDIKALYPNTGAWMLPINYLRFFFWRVTKSTIFIK